MMRPLWPVLFISAILSSAAHKGILAQTPSWSLRPADRVVFYGDSITEQRFYTWWTELYAVTRFPTQHVQFWNAGVGGDRVSGGFGGTIEERLSRDVYAHQPTMVTVMLGMNDGSYQKMTPAIEAAYTTGYEHILEALASHLPSVRVLAIGPSAYDETTRRPIIDGGYNETLQAFSRDDRTLAAKHEASYIDANAPMVRMLQQANKLDSPAAQLLVPDRVHPEISAHLVIAMAVLDAWHAPPLVSLTAIDATAVRVLPSTQAAHITNLHKDELGIHWEALEDALPMPMGYGHAGYALVKETTGFTERFNEEPLMIANLPTGSYRLRIDDIDIGTFTATELQAGVNLAEQDTPMRRQSQNVEWTIRDKGDLQFVRTRIAIRKSSPETSAALDRAEKQLQEVIWHDATPVQHHFSLVRSPA